MSAIRFAEVTKQFAGTPRPAVNNCSFEVESGSFTVFLGPSGCGKTTLLKMVNRLYEPTHGTIYLEDTDVRTFKVTTLRQQIGYVIQQVGLFPHMTVAQNIGVVPQLLGWQRDKIEERVDELLTLIHLTPDEYRDRYPAQLSGGQQQRVGLARALAGDPKVLLMDEPFGAIDAITRLSLQDEMLRLQRHLRKTILFVTHDVEEALRMADKIVVMQAGSVVQYDTPFAILTHPSSAFVHDLVGADDMLRQLSQLPVHAAMAKVPANYHRNGEPTISSHSDLRNALSLLLRTGAPMLTVLNDLSEVHSGNGHGNEHGNEHSEDAIGVLSLEHIRDLASEHGAGQSAL
jgi:osmoprotectant transport system ATP-binding protein